MGRRRAASATQRAKASGMGRPPQRSIRRRRPPQAAFGGHERRGPPRARGRPASLRQHTHKPDRDAKMNLSAPFVRRPIATVLLTIGVALAGIGAFFVLPVSPLPQVDYPTISVSAQLPGASPDTMATSVATPLERRLGTISGVNEMTSSSQV